MTESTNSRSLVTVLLWFNCYTPLSQVTTLGVDVKLSNGRNKLKRGNSLVGSWGDD